MRIQLQLAPAAPTHLCEACWPRGCRSEVGLGVLPPGIQIQIPGRQLQLIRERRGGGKPGIRLCPAARPLRGMVSPSPAPRAPAPASDRGAARQLCALVQPPGERLSPRSRQPPSAARSTLQAVLKGDNAPRPAGRPRAPSLRPLGQQPPLLLQKGARTHSRAPGKARGARLQDRAIGGAGRLPSAPTPASPTSPPPHSLPSSLAPSFPLCSPPPLTERLPYKIYESAFSSRCRAPSYSQGSGAQPCGAASQGVLTAPAPGDGPWPGSVQLPTPAPPASLRAI